MKTQHTPGPWVANEDGLVYSTNKQLRKHNVICAVHPADATLIAAAPELLAALKAILARVESGEGMGGKFLGGPPLPIREARAAIAKAGGAQ